MHLIQYLTPGLWFPRAAYSVPSSGPDGAVGFCGSSAVTFSTASRAPLTTPLPTWPTGPSDDAGAGVAAGGVVAAGAPELPG